MYSYKFLRERTFLIVTWGAEESRRGKNLSASTLKVGGVKIWVQHPYKTPFIDIISKNFAAAAAAAGLSLSWPTHYLSNRMQMSLDSNAGCYKMTCVNMYHLDLYPMLSRGGGAKFQCIDFQWGGQVFSAPMWRGGQVFSAQESRNSSALRYWLIMTAP